MHTYASNGYWFNYNSDLSGDVRILDKKMGIEMQVSGTALFDFIAEYVRSEKIRRIEDASPEELLGIGSGQ